MLVSSRATVRAHTVWGASRSTVRLSKGLRASSITFFRKKEQQPLTNRKLRTASLKERFLQEHATGELERVTKDERASLFSALQSVWTRPGPGPDDPSLTQTLIIQLVYCIWSMTVNSLALYTLDLNSAFPKQPMAAVTYFLRLHLFLNLRTQN